MMMPKKILLLSVGFVLMLPASQAFAAGPLRVWEPWGNASSKDLAGAGRLANRQEHGDMVYLTYEPMVGSLPVFESDIVVTARRSGPLLRVSSLGLSSAVAGGRAIRSPVSLGLPSEASIALGYLDMGDLLVPVYRVVEPPSDRGLWIEYRDARSGKRVFAYDAVVRHKAMVYSENPIATPERIEVFLPRITKDPKLSANTFGEYARVASCWDAQGTTCMLWQHRAKALNETDGFTKLVPLSSGTTLDDAFAEVQAYYAVDEMRDWFGQTFGFSARFSDAEYFKAHKYTQGEQLLGDYLWVFVNAWVEDGAYVGAGPYGYADYMFLGNLHGRDLAYDNDVARHEYTHAVASRAFHIQKISWDKWGGDQTGVAVEEAVADYFAATRGTTTMIAELIQIGRDVNNTATCPASLQGEGHADGLIASGALWEIREAMGANKTDHLVYGALAGNPVGDFDDFGNALISQAGLMASADFDEALRLTETQVEEVRAILEGRMLFDCIRIVAMEPNRNPPYVYQQKAFLSSQGTPSGVQYEVTVTKAAPSFTLQISPQGDPSYDILLRKNQPIEFEWSGDEEGALSWTSEQDLYYAHPGGGNAFSSLQVTPGSGATELAIGDKYYISFVCRPKANSPFGCANYLSFKFDKFKPQDTDSGTGGGADTGPDPDTSAQPGDTGDQPLDTDGTNVDTQLEPDTDVEDDIGMPGANEEMGISSDASCGCRLVGPLAPFISLWKITLLLLR